MQCLDCSYKLALTIILCWLYTLAHKLITLVSVLIGELHYLLIIKNKLNKQ